jgi:hypothetical protein
MKETLRGALRGIAKMMLAKLEEIQNSNANKSMQYTEKSPM